MPQDLTPQEQLLHACYRGDLPGVKKLLAAGATINGTAYAPDHSPGRPVSPLSEAVTANHTDIVKFLISKGASVEGPAGAYALWVARSEDVAKLLIAKGADINAADPHQGTPLFGPMAYCEARRVSWMLKLGADPNGRDRDGETPLHQLVRYSWKPVETIIGALLARGADINATSKTGQTPLMVAVRNGKTETVRVLLRKGADPTRKDAEGKSAADHAKPALKKELRKWESNPSAAAATRVPSARKPTLPKRLERFYKTSEAARYKGFVAKGLPYYTRDSKVKITFVKPGPALLEENDVDSDIHFQWMPLARLRDEAEFLAVKLTSPNCPVYLWWHEDQKFYPVAKTLDDFLKQKLTRP
jgi:hypothetical protein